MILTVTLNAAVDKTVEINDFVAGKVNRVSSVRIDAGGKGVNVSKVIKSLGGSSRAVGILGGSTGRFIREYLESCGIENDFRMVQAETRTNLKVIDSIRKTNTDINEPGPDIMAGDLIKLEEAILGNIGENTILVLSGSVPANVDKSIYARWISAAKAAGAKTVLDADGDLLKHGLEAGPTLVKPNIHELERLFQAKINDAISAERYARRLIEQKGIGTVVVSMGERGAVYVNRDRSILAHGIPVEVRSTVGAGDSMVAALALCMDRQLDFEKSVRLSMAAGTANVMTSGTQPADYGMIAELEKKVRMECLYRRG